MEIKIVLIGCSVLLKLDFRRRAKFEQFELSGKYKFSRFPSKKSAIAEITRLVKER